jgi:hypothetical protein
MTLDADFVADHPCIARSWMSAPQRWFADIMCRVLGHNLWRTGTIRVDVHSLPLKTSYCRRCFKGGYVQGDYADVKR